VAVEAAVATTLIFAGRNRIIVIPWICPFLCVNDRTLFLGMGSQGKLSFPFPCMST